MKKSFKTGEKIWIGTFVTLWVLVSTVSTFHSLDFFGLSNDTFLSWLLAIGFEIGAMASLGGMLVSKGNKTIVWMLFILLTAFQIHGNMYFAWSHAGDISEWTKLFDLVDEDPNFTKRIFAFISGGILPLVSLGFIKSLMDYMKPKEDVTLDEKIEDTEKELDELEEELDELENDVEGLEDLIEEIEENQDDIEESPSELDIKIETKKVEGGDTIKVETPLLEQKPEQFSVQPIGASGWKGNEESFQEEEYVQDGFVVDDSKEFVDEPKEMVELNKKRPSTKLGDIIDDAENTVNSIGEK